MEQKKLIEATIAELKAMSPSNGTLDKIIGSGKVISYLNENLGAMDTLMMAEGDRLAKDPDLDLVKKIFQDIHSKVYEWGRKTALAVDLLYYMAKNSTDGKIGLAKFAVTSKVIRWRCELDAERRENCPTVCKDEQGGWADWNKETKKVQDTLKKLIPELTAAKSDFWAHQHQRVSYLAQ